MLQVVSKEFFDKEIENKGIKFVPYLVKSLADKLAMFWNFSHFALVDNGKINYIVCFPMLNRVLIPSDCTHDILEKFLNEKLQDFKDSWSLDITKLERSSYTLNELFRGSYLSESYYWPTSFKGIFKYTGDEISFCRLTNKVTHEVIEFERSIQIEQDRFRPDEYKYLIGFEEKKKIPYDYNECRIKECFIKGILFNL